MVIRTSWLPVHIGLLLVLVGSSIPASAQDPMQITSGAQLEISGRVQAQFNTTTADDVETSQWLMRRVRLGVDVTINDIVSGVIEPEFAGSDIQLKDAYVQFEFDSAFAVIAGKAYRPFSRLEMTSSTRILPIERGLRIRGIDGLDHYELINGLGYSDRDVGLQVKGDIDGLPLGLSYAAGVFAGPLQGEAGGEDPTQFAARINLQPARNVQVGLGWSSREFIDPIGANALQRGHAFEVDFEYGSFAPGLHLLAELAAGDYDPFNDTDFVAAQGWLAYRTDEIGSVISAVEPVLRLSYGDVDDDALERGGTLLTPGLNIHFGGRNRVMVNYDFWSPDGADGEGSFKVMFQMAF